MKRLFELILASVLLFGFAVMAFAEGYPGRGAPNYILRMAPSNNTCSDITLNNATEYSTVVSGCVYDGIVYNGDVTGHKSQSISSGVISVYRDDTTIDNQCIVSKTPIPSDAFYVQLASGSSNTASAGGLIVNSYSDYSCTHANRIFLLSQKNTATWWDLYDVPSVLGVDLSYAWSTGTYYDVALLFGGYNSSGIPYKIGDNKSQYTYGVTTFRNIAGTWTMLSKTSANNSASTYVALQNYSATVPSPVTVSIKDWVMPRTDFSDLIQPTVLDTFTGASGELDAHTSDVGGPWTENSGDFDLSTNKVVATAAGMATFDAGISTALYDCTITTPASGTTNGGMLARYVDATHYWYLALDDDDNLMKLYEANGSEPGDLRISDAKTIAANTAYKVRLIVSSASPYWSVFVDGVAEGTYTTEGSSSTATKWGIKDEGNANIVGWDNCAIWPRTDNRYDNMLGRF